MKRLHILIYPLLFAPVSAPAHPGHDSITVAASLSHRQDSLVWLALTLLLVAGLLAFVAIQPRLNRQPDDV